MDKRVQISKSMKWNLGLQIAVPVVLLILGIYHGLMQTIYRSGLISDTSFLGLEYYQGLTLHGVINALVLTTFGGVAIGHYVNAYFLKKEIHPLLNTVSTALMLIGSLMAAWAMLMGKASVLYTFYPPLKAHPLFYLGAALLIVGSWLAYFGWIFLYMEWKKENPGEKVPLAIVGNQANFTIWFFCTLAVAYEVLAMLIPWSLGWKEAINIPLSRTLFWFFGHALVYFWLLPSYILFYTALPRLVGGKLYSDTAGRVVFFLFLIFSIPVGVHHQFSEPTIQQNVKFFQSILTYGVAIPSLLTAFTIAASLEFGGRRPGDKSLFGWMTKLPWFQSDKYLFGYLICGLILFIFGGTTGLVLASYSLNSVMHNTAFLPGHFHMTVGGPVFLALLGFGIYMISNITNKPVRFKRMLTIVPYLWVIGISIFSSGLMWGGLIGEPRRTNLGLSYLNPDNPLFRADWVPTTMMALFGGIIMTLAFVFYIIPFFATLLAPATEPDGITYPETDVIHEERKIAIFHTFKPWVALMIVLIFLAYIPALYQSMKNTGKKAVPVNPDGTIETFDGDIPKDLVDQHIKDIQPVEE